MLVYTRLKHCSYGVVRSMSSRRWLQADGAFLATVGIVQVVQELLGHFAGKGMLAAAFEHSPYTIGFVEAHALAATVGVLLIRFSESPDVRFWHLYAVLVHVILGGANVLFWDSFQAFGLTAMGIGATALHGLFIVGHAVRYGKVKGGGHAA